MTEPQGKCLACDMTSDQVPLITLRFQGKEIFICSQHLPLLIHHPEQLVEFLPGMKISQEK